MIVIKIRTSVSYLRLIQRFKGAQSGGQNETFGQPQHEFGSTGTRRIAAELHGVEGTDAQCKSSASNPPQPDEDPILPAYNQTTTVSLHSCMQSSVPEPYEGSPPHVNMPGGGKLRNEKYVYAGVQDTHPTRSFHSSSSNFNSRTSAHVSFQGVQNESSGTQIPVYDLLNSPCPQGIQGDECSQFKVWLANCMRHDGVDCGKLANDYTAGRKTLSEIFAQYDKEIRSVQYVQKRSFCTERQLSGLSTPSPDPSSAGTVQPLSQRQKLKQAIKDYGSTVVVFHVAISLVSLGGCYLAVSSNIDFLALLTKLGASEKVLSSLEHATTFAIAYVIHKMLMPVRIGTTLTATPIIVKYLRAKGVLTPPK